MLSTSGVFALMAVAASGNVERADQVDLDHFA